ncbi:MAG: c-type cytochrome [Bacteroidota bacterium]|nr:c-type cytochrome [Bacteroidota bacterium]
MIVQRLIPFTGLVGFILLVASCTQKTKYTDRIYKKPTIVANPQIKSLTPEESLKRMYLPEGYTIELVASEPLIGEPVSIAWDGDGRMYVAQMLTYMQDVDGTNENEPWSRISLLEDVNKDGRMDKSTVFIDSLILPRIMLPLDNRIIIGETFNRSLYSYRDTNGDGKADEKILLLEDTARDNRNLEHQDANLLWSIDNWLYLTNKAFRYRFANNTLIRDTLREPMPGQWGLTQDETGRLFFSRAGAEVPALGFQQHPVYGSLEMKDKWDESFMEPWPIVGTPDAQGGPRRIRSGDNTLNRFTGVAGQEIYLGDKMPPAYGDLFIPEPVGRLVRRAKVNHVNGKIVLENRYHQAEFLASTDPLFRPVYATTGPDGCLYIVDMYRGIIQEGTWVGEGSYLRGVVKEKGYDRFVQRGRIYRVYHKKMEPGPAPQLLHKTSSELIEYLSHPNGWWRMTAQKLIILKGDPSVVNKLREIVQGNEGFFTKLFQPGKDFALERLHALWTLEGLQRIDPSLLKTALRDKDPRVRAAAIRISEPYLKTNNAEIFQALKGLLHDENPEVVQQLLLTFRSKANETKPLVQEVVKRFPKNDVIQVTAKENLNPAFSELQALSEQYKLRGGEVATQIINGFRLFQENCATCHGQNGMGTPQLAPPLVGSPRLKGDPGMAIRILLHGLTGPVNGVEYNGPMASQAQYTDEELADILSYIREHLNGSGTIWRGSVRSIRDKYKDRKTYWTLEELAKEKK